MARCARPPARSARQPPARSAPLANPPLDPLATSPLAPLAMSPTRCARSTRRSLPPSTPTCRVCCGSRVRRRAPAPCAYAPPLRRPASPRRYCYRHVLCPSPVSLHPQGTRTPPTSLQRQNDNSHKNQLWHDQTEDYGGQCDGLDTPARIPASAWPEAATPKCPWIRPQRAGYSAYGGGYHSQRVPFER